MTPLNQTENPKAVLRRIIQPGLTPRNSQPQTCERCGGFLVKDWIVSLCNDGGEVEVPTHRCIQCGEVTDPVLLQNRWSNIRGGSRKKPRNITKARP